MIRKLSRSAFGWRIRRLTSYAVSQKDVDGPRIKSGGDTPGHDPENEWFDTTGTRAF
jgi:hypothetical protein